MIHTTRRTVIALLLAAAAAAQAQAQFPLHRWRGTGSEHFKLEVTSAGDLDGDGHDDVLVGSPTWDPIVSSVGAVQVRAYSGATGAELLALREPVPGSQFGQELLTLDDIDGDGRPDFVVSAPGADLGAGVVGVVSAHSGLNGSLLWQRAGTVTDLRFGYALARTGDLDGDGFADLAVTAPVNPALPHLQPQVVMLSGATGAPLWTVSGEVGHGFGNSVASLGDVDGDGLDDLAVGDPITGLFSRGAVHILSGADGSLLRTIDGGFYDQLGGSLCGPGDIDGDGIGDLAASGISPPEGVRIYSGLTGAWIRSLSGKVHMLEAVGDVDLDGTPDVLAAALDSMQVLSGADGTQLRRYFPYLPNANVLAIAAADLDGDGRGDFLLGAQGIEEGYILPGGGEVLAFPGAPTSDAVRSCFGDGSDGDCPGVYGGSPGAGCADQVPAPPYAITRGARLFADGSASVSSDDLSFSVNFERAGWPASFCPATRNPFAVLLAGSEHDPAAPFEAGLLCAGGTLLPLVLWASTGPTATFGPGLGALGGWSAGQRRTFQVWYRDLTAIGCAGYQLLPGRSNLSNAVDVRFSP